MTTISKAQAHLGTPSDLDASSRTIVGTAIHQLTSDVVALYFKTKAYHWHVFGPHFKEYHELFDDQAAQVFAMIDTLAERARKLGQLTIRGVADVARTTRIVDDTREATEPHAMIRALIEDNRTLLSYMRQIHSLADEASDYATSSTLDVFIDETERRVWFLFETTSEM